MDQYKVDKEGALTDNHSLRLLDGLDYSIKNMLTKRHAKLNNDTFLPQGLPVQGFFTIEKRKSFPITEFHVGLGFLACLMNVQMARRTSIFLVSY